MISARSCGGRHQKHFDVAVGVPVHQRRPAGQLADLRKKMSAPLPHDRHHVAQSVALADRHFA